MRKRNVNPSLSMTSLAAFAIASSTALASEWSEPALLVNNHGRLAIGNQLHAVGHIGSKLVHRTSTDDGETWSDPGIIGPASGNFPMQYGGFYAQDDSLFLITAAGHMGSTSQHLDFRKSSDNGQTWSHPARITAAGQQIRRANIAVRGDSVHVFGGQSGAGGYGTGLYYFRSTDAGNTWDPACFCTRTPTPAPSWPWTATTSTSPSATRSRPTASVGERTTCDPPTTARPGPTPS